MGGLFFYRVVAHTLSAILERINNAGSILCQKVKTKEKKSKNLKKTKRFNSRLERQYLVRVLNKDQQR